MSEHTVHCCIGACTTRNVPFECVLFNVNILLSCVVNDVLRLRYKGSGASLERWLQAAAAAVGIPVASRSGS